MTSNRFRKPEHDKPFKSPKQHHDIAVITGKLLSINKYLQKASQLTFTSSKSTIEKLEKGVRYVQS